jgi:hypothetical protein
MGKFKSNFKIVLGLVLATLLVGFFQNCSQAGPDEPSQQADLPSTPENYLWLEDAVPSGLRSIDYFVTSKPNDMAGFEGYRFIYSEYLVKKCTVCHRPPSGQLPHFGTTPVSYSYDIAKSSFGTSDMLVRVTNNPHCPECTLDRRGEVYQAIRYWLEHR